MSEEIPPINIKKECSVSCDEIEHDPSEPDLAIGGCDEKMSRDWSVKDEMFEDILIKAEIKVEDLEDEIPLPNHVEERLDFQEKNSVNATSQPVVQNCLQEKMLSLTLIAKRGSSNSNSTALLFRRSEKLKKTLRSTEKEEICTLSLNGRTPTAEKPFKCSSCSYQTARKGQLNTHERIHTGERPYKCSSCPYQAARKRVLKVHERTHTGERPYKCRFCSYQAMYLSALKNHERTHTGEKPFKCSSCPYQAARIENLKRHAIIHSSERPFKCTSCPYQVARKERLKTHARMHTGERPFKCSSCSFQAMTLGSLNKHAKCHTTIMPF